MISLHGWEQKETPALQEPWRAYTANATWVVGGTTRYKEVILGPSSNLVNAGIELNFCFSANSSVSIECREDDM